MDRQTLRNVISHEKKIVCGHEKRFLDDLTRREFLKVTKGMALGLCASALLGGKLFAGDEDMDLPVLPPRRNRPEDLYAPSDEPEEEPEPEEPPMFYGHELPDTGSVFYIMDRSMSMDTNVGQGVDPEGMLIRRNTRFWRARSEITESIRGLPRRYRFNVLVFNCYSRVWEQHLVEASDNHKNEASRWLNNPDIVFPAGLTGTAYALACALQEHDNHYIALLTDGAPRCHVDQGTDIEIIEQHLKLIRSNNRNRTIIDVFGIGTYGDFRNFCMAVASDSGGRFYEVI